METPLLDELLARESRPAAAPEAVPEWAAEAVLDEVFASWSPGPPPEAPSPEWEMARQLGAGGEAPAPPPVRRAAEPCWERSDDDVLLGPRGGVFRRRARAATRGRLSRRG